jgi:uncharacterized protein with HEPN domain
MPDIAIRESLEFILHSLELVQERFKQVGQPEYFVETDAGLTLMDAIAMRLQVLSEKMKKVEQASPGLFEQFDIEAKPIIKFRDFISHHYDEADYEVLFDICQNYLPGLKVKIQQMLEKGSF